jgi:uncharacterized cupin superfamily protein
MRKIMLATVFVALGGVAAAQDNSHPILVTGAAVQGPVFQGPGVLTGRNGVTKDFPMIDSDKGVFTAGAYSAPAGGFDSKGYAHDEFMFFVKGSVKLTSADGTVTHVNAGDAVVLKKGWKGRWETPGYTKYYVIYEPK